MATTKQLRGMGRLWVDDKVWNRLQQQAMDRTKKRRAANKRARAARRKQRVK